MHRAHRRLSPSFIAHLDALHLFPGRKELRNWRTTKRLPGFANEFYGPMKDGEPVPRRIIDLLCLFCMLRHSEDGLSPHADALLAYCRSKGLESIESRYRPQIIDLISTSAAARPTKPLDNASAFISGLAQNAASANSALSEASDADLPRYVEWFAVEYGRQIAPRPLGYSEALRAGLQRRGTDTDRYLRALRSWKAVAPLVAGVAIENGIEIGAAVALPLRERSYHLVRAGRLNTRDLRPSDLSEHSRFLFLEAIVMAPHRMTARQKEPTNTLVAAFFVQLALLSRVRALAKNSPIHILSATFSEYSRKRLAGLGCAIIGARHADTDHELMERVIDISRPNNHDAAIWGNWRSLQAQLTAARMQPSPGRASVPPSASPSRSREMQAGQG